MSIEINTPFDLLKNITNKTGYIHDPSVYSKYMFMVITFLSYHRPYIDVVEEVNKLSYTDKMAYDFLYTVIPKQYIKLTFPKKTDATRIQCIMDYFNYNRDKAYQIESLISDDDLIEMKKELILNESL